MLTAKEIIRFRTLVNKLEYQALTPIENRDHHLINIKIESEMLEEIKKQIVKKEIHEFSDHITFTIKLNNG